MGVSFNSFSSKEAYLKLQNDFFYQCDSNIDQIGFSEIQVDDFEITKITHDIQTDIAEYKYFWFEKDFLADETILLSEKYIKNFEKTIETEFLYKKEEKEEYINIQFQRINNLEQRISEYDYLTDMIKNIIHNQLIQVSDYIYNKYIISKHDDNEKIKINLSQTELILLMLILKQNKIIKENHNNILGQWIEKTFLAFDSESNEFVKVNRASKKLSDFTNNNKTSTFALENLKKIFSQDNFFNLDI